MRIHRARCVPFIAIAKDPGISMHQSSTSRTRLTIPAVFDSLPIPDADAVTPREEEESAAQGELRNDRRVGPGSCRERLGLLLSKW